MGVRGLTTYVNSNQDVFLQYYLLHNTSLVVDGNSMCAQLYRSLNCFSAFGGDYDKFASYVRNFLKNIRKCNITPYVIFDGSHESRKLRTTYSRLRSKISGASRLDPVTQGNLQIFPLLLREVFKQTLVEMDIPYTVCEFEADDEIATMARHLNCPVLSYDSDFFIYNVLYIPFNTLERKAKPFYVDGNRFHALECKLYKVQYLTENFGGLREEMLPLLATLLGNDYVEKRVFKRFFSQLKLPKSKKCKNEQQRCIHGIFKWLQNETLDMAISKILGRVKKAHKQKVLNVIKKSIDGYNKKHCRSLKYFKICDEISSDEKFKLTENFDLQNEVSENDTLSSDDSSDEDASSEDSNDDNEDDDEELVLGLPEWFAESVRSNHTPQSHINLYTHHLYFCNPQAEDYKAEDSFLCNLPVLRYIFDLLTDFEHDNCIYVSREKDCNYRRVPVDREYSVPRLLDVPFNELTIDQMHLCFNHFFKVKLPALDMQLIKLLPSNFQLYMISILWWLATCEVSLAHIHSLLVCYVMLEVVDERTGTFRGYRQFLNNYSKKIEELKKIKPTNNYDEDLFINKCKVQYEDCLFAANSLLKHFEIDESILKKPKSYDARKMHSFAQFQNCLMQVNALNCLCRNPYEATKYHKCFNGTFVYNVALKLENQIDPIKFIEQYLNGATTVLMFYKSLCSIYDKCVNAMGLTTTKYLGKKHKRRKNKKGNDEVDDIINSFLIEGFESQVVI